MYEVFGYAIIDKNLIPDSVKLSNYTLNVKGAVDSNNRAYLEYSVSCYVKTLIPSVEEEQQQEKYFDRETMIKGSFSCDIDTSLNITNATDITLVKYDNESGEKIQISNFTGVLINYIANDNTSSNVDQTLQKISEILNNISIPNIDMDNIFNRQDNGYESFYKNTNIDNIYNISNGEIGIDNQTDPESGIVKTYYKWNGTSLLDRLINVINCNLDILYKNKSLKNDQLSIIYTQLMQRAMELATQSELDRNKLYEESSQFRIKTSMEYSLSVLNNSLTAIKTLLETQLVKLNKDKLRMETKLAYIQFRGYSANNIYKLFDTQLSGISSAFSSGMLEKPSAVYNDSEALTLYAKTMNIMDIN